MLPSIRSFAARLRCRPLLAVVLAAGAVTLMVSAAPGVTAPTNHTVGGATALQTPGPTGRIVVRFAAATQLTIREEGLTGGSAADRLRVASLAARVTGGSELQRRFTRPSSAIDASRIAAQARGAGVMPDLNRYAQLEVSGSLDRERLLEIRRELLADPAVEIAWLEPVAVPAALGFDALTGAVPPVPTQERPETGWPPRVLTQRDRTPDFIDLQGYLLAAPNGIGALAVSDVPGALGAALQVIDIEGAWLWTHEDLVAPFATFGDPIDDLGWRNHGTAVLAEVRGDDNEFGVRGIAPLCAIGGSSIGNQSVADAIDNAAAVLAPGDVLIIELHAPGPHATGDGQFGYVPMEFWPDNFDAMLLATSAGLVVCEAAGNGQQDLDDPIYQGLFDRLQRDSGALLCGATNAGSLDPAWFTNHGTRVDLCGWGSQVTTCAYGDLQGDPLPETEWYTAQFGGTSSATPIVVGAVVALQGMVIAASGAPLDASLCRTILSETGTPTNGPELIGPRPDLVAAWVLAQDGYATVEGVVTDAGTGQPVAGVSVEVYGKGRILTDTDGRYRLTFLPGLELITFTTFSYDYEGEILDLLPGQIVTLDVALVVSELINPEGDIRAMETAEPLADVRVTPNHPALTPTLTDAAGHFELMGVPESFWELTLVCDGLPGHGVVAHPYYTVGLPEERLRRPSLSLLLPAAVTDFEAGPGDFTADNLWEYGTPTTGPGGGFGGDYCWGVGMHGNYPDAASGTLTSPVYHLEYTGPPGIGHTLQLSFHYWSDTETGWDGVRLEVWHDAAWHYRFPLTEYTDVALSGLDQMAGWSGDSDGWRGALFDLSGLVPSGPTDFDLQFRLIFGSDDYVDGNGFWIDDIALAMRSTVTPVPQDLPSPGTSPLLTAYPNPFNPTVTIAWRLSRPGQLRVELFDLRGRRIVTLHDSSVGTEIGSVTWDGRDATGRAVASGTYLVRLRSPSEQVVTRRIVLAR